MGGRQSISRVGVLNARGSARWTGGFSLALYTFALSSGADVKKSLSCTINQTGGCFWLKVVCDVRRISCLLYCKRVIPQLEPLDIMTNETSPNYVNIYYIFKYVINIYLSHVQESMFVLEEMHCMLFCISMISKYKMISKNWWYSKYWGQWPFVWNKKIHLYT